MTDEERQRTMDFILQQQAQFTVNMQKLEEQQTQFAEQQTQFAEQQAQFSAGMQKLEEADERASKRLSRLERTLVLMARQFRRERRDLRERISALVDAQMKTEELVRQNSEAINQNNRLLKKVEIRPSRGSQSARGQSRGANQHHHELGDRDDDESDRRHRSRL